jgi:hypothetical protein
MLSRGVNDVLLQSMIGEDAFRLLRWVLLSNMAHLITIPEPMRLTEFPCAVQFMTLLANPYADARFNELESKHGSVFLWHGSSGARWHPILRNGLKNASGTGLMANGDSLGSGIYMARDSATSWDYSHPWVNHYRGSALGPSIHAISLCEVARVPTLHNYGWAHVLEDEEAVIVRFLFVNANLPSPAPSPGPVAGRGTGKSGKGGRRSKKKTVQVCAYSESGYGAADVLSETPCTIPTLADVLRFYSAHPP